MANGIETADLYRGAYLLCCGGRIGVIRLVRGQVLFAIEGEGVVEQDRRYRTGQALVNPVQLKESVNLLRDLVFERLREKRREYGPDPARGSRAS